jgi:hypothetical protein
LTALGPPPNNANNLKNNSPHYPVSAPPGTIEV